MINPEKVFTIISGPNGACKTTFVKNLSPNLLKTGRFLNAHVFAQELSLNDVHKVAISAGKKFLNEIDRFFEKKQSFMIETTLSGKVLLEKVQQAQQKGFIVKLIFLWISSEELCDFRVKNRVALGGHNILYADILRRYKRGLTNFTQYFEKVNECSVYFSNAHPTLVYSKNREGKVTIVNQELYEDFQKSLEKYKVTLSPK